MKYKELLGTFCLSASAILFGSLVGVGVNRWIPDVFAGQEATQEQGKTVKLAYSRKPIIKISQLKVGNKDLNFGENIDEDDDWLKNLSFKLKNESGKPIIYLRINVNFPETRATGNLMSFPIVFGQIPDIVNHSKNSPFLYKPNDSIEVSLSDKDYNELVKFINTRSPINSMRKLELEIGFVIFDDKTAWTAGQYLRQDPNNPRSYINTESNLSH